MRATPEPEQRTEVTALHHEKAKQNQNQRPAQISLSPLEYTKHGMKSRITTLHIDSIKIVSPKHSNMFS